MKHGTKKRAAFAFAGVLIAFASFNAFAQAQPDPGIVRAGQALGQLLTGHIGTPGVYENAYQQRIETESAYWGAVRAKQEVDAAEQRQQMVSILTDTWIKIGLPPDEATAVASTFDYTPELDAIVLRAKRDGQKATLAAAGTAYRAYQYQLANQLLIAGLIAETPDPTSDPIEVPAQ